MEPLDSFFFALTCYCCGLKSILLPASGLQLPEVIHGLLGEGVMLEIQLATAGNTTRVDSTFGQSSFH